jgi:CheY-like chemotaxis protein
MSGPSFTPSAASVDPSQPPIPDPRPAYRVAAFGLGARLQRIAEIVFRHARHNPYRFQVVASREPDDFDLALVDMTTQGARDIARTLRGLARARTVVTVGRRQDPTRVCDDLVLHRFALNLLTVLNRVVEQHRVAVSVRHEAAAPLSAGMRPSEVLERALGRRPRVLLIDPSPVARRQLSLALATLGLDAEGVGTAAEARDILALRRYEGVLLDSELPDANGLSIVRDLRRDPAWRCTPTIVLTRRSSPWDKLKAAAAGCDAYLVKPSSTSVLKATVLRCIERGSPVVTPTPAVPVATAQPAWASLRARVSRLSASARLQMQG